MPRDVISLTYPPRIGTMEEAVRSGLDRYEYSAPATATSPASLALAPLWPSLVSLVDAPLAEGASSSAIE